MRRSLTAILVVLSLIYVWVGRAAAEEYWHPRTYGIAARQAIMNDLYNGTIWGAHEVGSNWHQHPLYEANCSNNGNTRRVFLKPHVPELIFSNNGSFDNPIGEAIMHKLDHMLRGAYVPPAANRRWVNLPWGTSDFCTVTVGLNNVRSSWGQDIGRDRPYSREFLASELAIRGALVHNGDVKTPQNTVIGDHWVDGRNSGMFLDWAGSFKGEHQLTWDNGIMAGRDIQHFNLATYQAMKKLSFGDLQREMRDSTIPGCWMSDDQIRSTLNARDGIVGYIDNLVRQRGAENVFFRKGNAYDPGPYGWID